MSTLSGQVISRTGKLKMWPVLGVSLMVTGMVLLSRIGVYTPFWRTAVFMLVFGWGLGCCMQTLTLAVQNSMPPKDMGVATASATFFRQMGGTMGTAVFLSILFSTVSDRIGSAFRAATSSPSFQAALADPSVRADPANQAVLSAVSDGGVGAFSLDDSSFLGRIDGRLALPFLQGFSGSMSLTFLVGAAVLVIALALVIFLPEVPLRQQSGIEAQRSAPAATRVEEQGVIDRVDERTLADLVPDPARALATLRVAEQARDNARRARQELDEQTTALVLAQRELAGYGLSVDQVNHLLRLSAAEAARSA
jgi:hypothetical protein